MSRFILVVVLFLHVVLHFPLNVKHFIRSACSFWRQMFVQQLCSLRARLMSLSLAGLILSYLQPLDVRLTPSWETQHERKRTPSYPHSSSVREVGLWSFPLSCEYIMESVVRMKKFLRMPIRKLTSCVSGVKERKLCAKPRNRRGRGGRGGRNRQWRTPPPRRAHPKDPSVIRSYQLDLEKERRVVAV